MNIPLFLVVLFLGHILGDFYFCYRIITNIKTSYLRLVTHGFVYAICIAFALLSLVWFGGVTYSHNLLWIFLIVSSSHLVIDFVKLCVIGEISFTTKNANRFINTIKKKITPLIKFIRKSRLINWIFSIDQITHIIILIFTWWLWGEEFVIGCYIYDFANHITIVLGLLCIIRPIGLLLESGIIRVFDTTENENEIVNLLKTFSLQTEQKDIDPITNCLETIKSQVVQEDLIKKIKHPRKIKLQIEQKDASRMIGYLERIVVFFMLLNGEFSAIALVLAAKSIARFPEIKNEENHIQANHYIIGTFLSLTSVFTIATLLGLIRTL